MVQDFKKDIDILFEKINKKEPFAFMRFADGEIGIMKGEPTYGVDGWMSPQGKNKLGIDLLESISRIDENIYYGISCECCDIAGKKYLLSLIKNPLKNVTFSNLFVNGNYNLFKKKLFELNESVYLIANHAAKLQNFPIRIEGFLPVPDNCVYFWEMFSVEFKEKLAHTFEGVNYKTFLISAGPMSEPIIDYLWKINPTNQYIDVGSSIGEYVHGRSIRDFVDEGSSYHNRDCVF